MHITKLPNLLTLVATVFYNNDYESVTQNSLFVDNKIISIRVTDDKTLFALIDKDLAFFEYSYTEKQFECLPVFIEYSRKKTLGKNLLKAIKKVQEKGFYEDVYIDLDNSYSNLIIAKNITHSVKANPLKEPDIQKIFFTECLRGIEEGYVTEDSDSWLKENCSPNGLLDFYKDKKIRKLIEDNAQLLTDWLDNYILLSNQKVHSATAKQQYLKLYKKPVKPNDFYEGLMKEGKLSHFESNLTLLLYKYDSEKTDVVSNKLLEKDQSIYKLIEFLLYLKFDLTDEEKLILKDSSRDVLESIRMNDSYYWWSKLHRILTDRDVWILSHFFQTPTVGTSITLYELIEWKEAIQIKFGNDTSFWVSLDGRNENRSINRYFDIPDGRNDMQKINYARTSNRKTITNYINKIIQNSKGLKYYADNELFKKLDELNDLMSEKPFSLSNVQELLSKNVSNKQKRLDEINDFIVESYQCLEDLHQFNANELSYYFGQILSKEQ